LLAAGTVKRAVLADFFAEVTVTRRYFSTVGLFFVSLAIGCGSNPSPPPTNGGSLPEPAANRRLKFKPEMKEMLKDGKPLWKPGETIKRTPKS
jgi:hypothetical protein